MLEHHKNVSCSTRTVVGEIPYFERNEASIARLCSIFLNASAPLTSSEHISKDTTAWWTHAFYVFTKAQLFWKVTLPLPKKRGFEALLVSFCFNLHMHIQAYAKLREYEQIHAEKDLHWIHPRTTHLLAVEIVPLEKSNTVKRMPQHLYPSHDKKKRTSLSPTPSRRFS